MSVVAELRVRAEDIDIGQAFNTDSSVVAEFEPIVPPIGDCNTQVKIPNSVQEDITTALMDHPAASNVTTVAEINGHSLVSFSWDEHSDSFLSAIKEHNGHAIAVVASVPEWTFTLRFPTRSALGSFKSACDSRSIDIDISRVFSPTMSETKQTYGLTPAQREAIALAIEMGYFDIPRQCTTIDLANELGISDQAVTERLRRAISNLVSNTLLNNPSLPK